MSAAQKFYKDPLKNLGEPNFESLFFSSAVPGLSEASGLSWLGGKYSEAMTPKMPEAPVQPTQDQAVTDAAIKEAAWSEVDRLRKKKGLRSTQMTGPAGITNPPTTFKTKLG